MVLEIGNMGNEPKKKTKRNSYKYPNLHPEVNLKSRFDLIDYDYIDKLSEKEKRWLNKFTKEYVNADLNYKDLSKNLHNTQKLKKDCTDRNNARNRDILTREKAAGLMEDFENVKNQEATKENDSSSSED